MFKILAFALNLVTLIFFNFLLEDVTVEQTLPDRVEEGNEFVVTVTIDKSTIEGYAKFQVILPEGVTATPIETGVAKFNFETNKAKFVWMTLPTDRVFDISYKVKVDDPELKELNIGGTFSYLDENQRMTVDLPARTVFMGKEEIIVEEIPEAEVTVQRTIKNMSDNFYKVTLDIHYSNVSGFAKIQDIIPENADVTPDEAADAVFSMLDTKVKFVWMNFPEDKNDISVSYMIDLSNASSKKITDLSGEFAFIHDGASQKIQIDNPAAIDFVDLEPNLIAETSKEQNQDNVPTKNNLDPIDLVDTEKEGEEIQKNIPITTIPAPENGVVFKVQVMASHKSVDVSSYFKKAFNYNGQVEVDSHEGWMKYLTGGFDNYVSARDLRQDHKANYSFRGPFVVAYNNGTRITVQEALMITNQKWVN
ncbi:MAG: hypothetical protein ACPGVC_05605 [Salibacteraceae bacterium]